MNNWIFYSNEKVVIWLNKSYNIRTHTILWLLRPDVLFQLVKRCFFIFCKLFIRADQPSNVVPLSNSNQQTQAKRSNYVSKSILDFLLFRKVEFYEEKILAIYQPLYNTAHFKPDDFKLLMPDSPIIVTIIIPVYNQIIHTLSCLRSITQNNTVSVEIIIVDDCSNDETFHFLSQISGIKLIRNQTNKGFLENCNLAAKEAKGEYLCFLNNDTQVQKDWLESLLDVFSTYEDAGIVGSALVYPDMRLQEAGGIIWEDASGMNVGKFQNPYNPLYRFVRPVDYCSGASFLIKKQTFKELGCFDKSFKPAYYEDTDLCFSVRFKFNKKVYYQPQSVVIHDEGLSSGTDINRGVKSHQAINQLTFRQKWASKLSLHNRSNQASLYKSMTQWCGRKTILIVDSYLPLYDKESGSNRIFWIIKILRSLQYHIIFLPDNQQKTEPYSTELQKMGIDVLYLSDKYPITIQEQLKTRINDIQIAWICRPELNQKYGQWLKTNKIKIIYDTIDLHFVRLQRKYELDTSQKHYKYEAEHYKKTETKLAINSSATIAITQDEKNILESYAIPNIHVIPNIHIFKGAPSNYSDREGLLFIGSYNHPPNIDAAIWLCCEIMPIIWQSIPNMKLNIIGQNPSPQLIALSSDKIKVLGYVPDVKPYFESSRVFVAPLRYGAGMKGKIGQSLEYALPIVTTSIGSEGMDLVPDQDILLAEEKFEFAQSVIKLYNDQELWERLHNNSEAAILKFSPEIIKKNIENIIENI